MKFTFDGNFGTHNIGDLDPVDIINAKIDANASEGSETRRAARVAKIDAAETMNDSRPIDPAEAEFIRILKANQEIETQKALRKQRESTDMASGNQLNLFEDIATSTLKSIVSSYTS